MSSEHSLFRLSRQQGYSTSRMASAFSNQAIEICGMLWGASCWSKLTPTNKNILIRALTLENGISASTAAG
ncbi:hypothetical protein TNCV_4664151 [Trichonephila clavipes]|nr:hypothetical protein TNCV_4664151 [Trichonephila clavipes]